MGHLFSRSPAQAPASTAKGDGSGKGKGVSEADKAVLQLKTQRDRLKQYQQRIQRVIDREVEIARAHLAKGDKQRALLCLRKKRYQEQLLEQTEAQLLNLEQLTNSIEFAAVQQQVIEGLKKGKDVLQQLNDQMKIEDVEKLMEDTADAMAYQQEISALLQESLTPEDDAEANAELDRILAEEQGAAGTLNFPAVPTKDPMASQPQAEQEEEPTANEDGEAEPVRPSASTRQRSAMVAS